MFEYRVALIEVRDFVCSNIKFVDFEASSIKGLIKEKMVGRCGLISS